MNPTRDNNILSDWRRWLALAALLSAATLSMAAAPVRVTTWSLPPAESGSTTNLTAQSAAVLKQLDADVILLQHVPDWQTCNDLASALKPANYKVAICSSFRDVRTGKLSRDQTAILSKATSYISWAEAWQGADQKPIGGGFAFAAMRVGGKGVGVFCVEPEHDGRGDVSAQLLKQIELLNHWTANKVDSHLVAGDFAGVETAAIPAHLINAGFADAIAALPDGGGQPTNSAGLIFVREAGRALNLVNASEIVSAHSPVTVELDLSAPPIPTPAKIVAVQKPAVAPGTTTNSAADGQASKPAVTPAVAPIVAAPDNRWLIGAGVGVVVLLVVASWLSHRPASRGSAAFPVKAGAASPGKTIAPPITTATTVSVERPTIINIDATSAAQTQSQYWQQRAEAAEQRADQASRALQAGAVPRLTHWLRERFVRRLATDRAVLLETQRVAAIKMLAVDERLARVERELKDRYRVYERRIDELLKELAVAREENRELIRARIELLKAEMEKERARGGIAKED